MASEILELKEGLRNILLTVEFTTNLKSDISQKLLTSNLEVYFSGKKKWLGPFAVLSNVKDDNEVIFSTGLNSTKNKLEIAFQLPKEEEAIVNYDSNVLGEYFNTNLPVCRILIKTENTDGHNLYRELVEKEFKNITVKVDVRGIKSLELESDIGKLNTEKPFYPFSTQPVKKSNFYIGYPELFKKEWKSFGVEIEWKNTPDNFKDLYYAYREKHKYKVSPNSFLEGQGEWLVMEKLPEYEFGLSESAKKMLGEAAFQPGEENLIVENDNYFKTNIEIQNREEWEVVDENKILFTKTGNDYKTTFRVTNSSYETDKNGQVRLSLNQSFLQELSHVFMHWHLAAKSKMYLFPTSHTLLLQRVQH